MLSKKAGEIKRINIICIDLECALGTKKGAELTKKLEEHASKIVDFQILKDKATEIVSIVKKVIDKEITEKDAMMKLIRIRQGIIRTR